MRRSTALLVRRSRYVLERLEIEKSCRCTLRYSVRPTCHRAEALQHLSCSCAHFRVQPDVARRFPATQAPPRSPEGSHGITRTSGSRQLSWSSDPLRRLSPSESTPPRIAAPGTFRPQGFSPSRRLPPRSNAQPCFMPVTPMGFCPSGVFPH